jgi:Secretion system C-terminal sorting domain
MINIKSTLKEFTTYVFDQTGRTVLTDKSSNQIDVSNLKTGIYFINLTSKESKRTSKLWIN